MSNCERLGCVEEAPQGSRTCYKHREQQSPLVISKDALSEWRDCSGCGVPSPGGSTHESTCPTLAPSIKLQPDEFHPYRISMDRGGHGPIIDLDRLVAALGVHVNEIVAQKLRDDGMEWVLEDTRVQADGSP